MSEFYCGCKLWVEGTTAYVTPCSEYCPTYQMILQESQTRGNTIEYRRVST